MNLAELRRSYAQHALDVADVQPNPIQQFKQWFEEAVSAQILEPNAMTLATVAANGRPAARIVLLKGFDQNGFVFFTNYESRKGQELATNPEATLLFCWLELERQVRIEGSVRKISREDTEAYFISRPKGSQIGAWASPQSQVIPSRQVLEDNQAALEQQYLSAETLPAPPHWGGYILEPDYIEFWQGRESRLHDRVVYRMEAGNWQIVRLAP